MVAINQRIPNFLGGVSQQPDSIKFPGQLRVCDNAVPDVTFGLLKRPPAEYVGKLANANDNGYWYEILRDGDEKFLIQITPANSASIPIRIWSLTDITVINTGNALTDRYETTVKSTNPTVYYAHGEVIPAGTEFELSNSSGDTLFQYLEQPATAEIPYALQTIQDYTIIANPQKTLATAGTTDPPLNSGEYSFARLDTIAYNTEYVVYSGSTAPAPNTYYRATALKVSKGGSDGNTWDDSNDDQRYAGLGQFSFSGGNNVTIPGSNVTIEDLEGFVTVNSASYVSSNTANYQGNNTGNAEDFLGYTQNYNIRYTAQITMRDGGLIKTTNKNTALASYIDLDIEGISYRITVDSVEPVETYEDVANIGFYRAPKNPDKGKLSMTGILQALQSSINSTLTNVTAEVIGNGLYLYGSSAPDINFLGGAVNEAMNVVGKTAQDISRLPSQCKHGYVAQISNADNTDSDNYYVKFLADNGTQGSGKWEETVRPHQFQGTGSGETVEKGWDATKMPHALFNNRTGIFTFKRLDETTANADGNDNYWKDRAVGDNETNPYPSINGLNVQGLFFHRSRLGLIADEQIVLSQPNDFFNLFIVSAITTSDDNPIDLTVSDIKPAFLNHTLPINKGVMCFSDNGQFLLFTESDILSPKTARLKKISSYESDPDLAPVDMGTSVMFASRVSAYTRAYESTILDDDVPPKVLEQTRVVPEFVSKQVDQIANTTGLGLVTFGQKNSSTLYHYKYYDSGEARDQSAWYTWTVTGTLQHMIYSGGLFFTLTKQGSDFILSRHEYVTDANQARSYVLGGAAADVGDPLKTARWFEACLDSMVTASGGELTYTAQTLTDPEKTVVTLPYTPTSADNFYLVGLQGTDSNGNDITGTVIKADSVSTNSATFNEDLQGWTIACGYRYTTTIELPNFFLAFEQGKYDLDGDLRISGINFEMGVSGPMEFHLTSPYQYVDSNGDTTKDIDDYVQYESGMFLDDTTFGTPPSQLSKSVRVPVQRKNEKYSLQIKVPDPFSTALISGSWDGKYSQRRYARK